MNRDELARELAVSEKLHLSTAVKAVDGIARIITETLAQGNPVFLPGLGALIVSQRIHPTSDAYTTPDPSTLTTFRSVRFRPSTNLKNLLRNDKMD